MAVNFATNKLLLTKQLVSASGNTLLVNGVEILSVISGNLIQTGIQLGASISSLSGFVGNVSGGLQAQIIANLNTDTIISGILTTGLTNTGVLLGASINSLSGFVGNVSGGLQAQINTKASIVTTDLISGNLIQTGVQLGASIASLSGFLGNVSGGLQAQINTKASIVTTDLISGNSITRMNSIGTSLSGNLFTTGSNLYVLTTGLSGYLIGLIGASSAGVSSINGASGVMTIAGAPLSNVTVTTVGQNIIISGNTGDYAFFAQKTDVTQTGIQLINRDFLISGILTTGLTNTGVLLGASITALSGFVGAVSGGLQSQIASVLAAANSIGATISGNLTATGVALISLINSLSGSNDNKFVTTGSILSYTTGVATGVDFGYYNFQNYTFATIPRVYATMELSSSNNMYGFIISGRSTTGFWAFYTDVVLEPGIFLDVLAKN